VTGRFPNSVWVHWYLHNAKMHRPLKIIIVFRDELLHSRLLYSSVVEGNESIVRLLLEYGADVNAADE
jgi:hypothetical protein